MNIGKNYPIILYHIYESNATTFNTICLKFTVYTQDFYKKLSSQYVYYKISNNIVKILTRAGSVAIEATVVIANI